MPSVPEIPKNAPQIRVQAKTSAAIQPQPSSAVPSPQPALGRNPVPANLSPDLRSLIPKVLLQYEPMPQEVFDQNPLMNERSAAVLLDVSSALLKKWRQRNWGPSYIQYGKDGPVRYEYATLMEFRARHRMQTRSRR